MEDADRIQAALKRPWSAGRMDPALERGFEARTGASRRRSLRTHLAFLLVMSLGCLPLDLQGRVLHDGIMLRCCVEAPLLLAGIWILRRDRPAWLQGLAAGVPVLIVLLCTVVLGMRSVPPFTDRYLMAAGILGAMANLMMRLRVPHAVTLTLVNVAAYCSLSLSGIVAAPSGQVQSLVAFFSLVMTLTLISAARRERADKDRYLYKLRDALQNRELARLVDELKRVADRDALTDLGNRRCFDRSFSLLWGDARVDGGRLSLAMIDVDFFKRFNDAAGHSEGDRCLRAVARAIAGQVRAQDVAARYGGEEFAVLMPLPGDPDAARAEAAGLAARIRAAVEALGLAHPGLGPDGRVTVSIGLADAAPGRDAQSMESLLDAADRALYGAKHGGRNRVTVAGDHPLAAAA